MTEPTDQDRYREYWAYLRHVETLRFTMGALLVTVASALIAVVYLAPPEDIAGDIVPWILAFLSIFVGVSAWFLVAHKKSYTVYFSLLKKMDPNLVDLQRHGAFEALLVLVTRPQVVIVASAFLLSSWAIWQTTILLYMVFVPATLAPWIYFLHETNRD